MKDITIPEGLNLKGHRSIELNRAVKPEYVTIMRPPPFKPDRSRKLGGGGIYILFVLLPASETPVTEKFGIRSWEYASVERVDNKPAEKITKLYFTNLHTPPKQVHLNPEVTFL